MAQFGFYKENREKNRIRQITGWIVDILAAAALAMFAVSMLINPTAIAGHSMEPALFADDVVLMSRIPPDLFPVRRFEVIEFRIPESEDQRSVKRVIGLPGETVRIRDGVIYIDDEALTDSPLSQSGQPVTIAGLAGEEILLDEEEFFVLGDNTGSSEDSRFTGVGNVRQSQITGRAWLRIRPSSRFGLIP